MASIYSTLSLAFFFLAFLFFSRPALAADSPANFPSLPHQPPTDGFSPSSSPATYSPAPFPAISISSPQSPPPSDIAPNSPPPAPSPFEAGATHTMSPSPAPTLAGDIRHENQPNAADLEMEESSGGMNVGQKAGVAIVVIAGACVVGAGALVYKKRQQNIRRSQYGYSARREIL